MNLYQPTKNNPYILPRILYRRILYLVRDYDRIKEQWESILHERPKLDGQPKATTVTDTTARIAIRRERLKILMEAVEQALIQIPDEYRDGILRHITDSEHFPDTAHLNTWKSWQARLLYRIAERLGEI